MDSNKYRCIGLQDGCIKRLVSIIIFLTVCISINAYTWVRTYKLGDTFTVSTSFYESNIYSIDWSYDSSVLQPVTTIGQITRSVTFKVIDASPSAGSAIQAVTWYYKTVAGMTGLMSSPIESWLVHAIDDTTVSLDYDEMTMDISSQKTLTATLSNKDSKTKYKWNASPSGIVTISSTGNKAKLTGKAAGATKVTVTLDNGNKAECMVTVKSPNVESAKVEPQYMPLEIDETKAVTLTVSPSNAAVTSKQWMSTRTSIATVNSSGQVTGKSNGYAEIYCVVNGSITSSTCIVEVSKPSFDLSYSSPSNNATGQSVHIKPSLTFCRQIYTESNFSNISLKDEYGNVVGGAASISGATLTFAPSEPLEPNTNYTFSVPAQAVRDKYNSTNSAVTRTFATGNLEKLTLTASTTEHFVTMGTKVTLVCNKSGTSIYYTLDGSTPTSASAQYQNEIIVNGDIKLRAIAIGAGYVDSDILSIDYLISNVEIVNKFPINEEPLFLYQDMIPYIVFSNNMEVGDNIGSVILKKNGVLIETEAIVNDHTLFIVPQEPLQLGCNYTINVPAGAVKTWQGENCKATSWTFSTGDFCTDIGISGELAGAVKTDGSLWTWGQRITQANANDGSYSYTVQNEPARIIDNDVVSISFGYMHHAMLKRDGSLWMWGRQYCGEFGNNGTTASAQPVKVMDGVASVSCGLQNTAIIKQDGSLWMCGRNDLGQIDDTHTVKKQFVMVAEDVSTVVLNWGSMHIVKKDGTTEDRVWDEMVDGQRPPTEHSSVVSEFAEVKYGWKNAIALGKDGSVWTWGEITEDTNMVKIIEGRVSSELTGLSAVNQTVSIAEGGKGVLTALPLPLTADYSEITWTNNNNDVASVDNRGVVTGIAKGTTTITSEFTSVDGKRFCQNFIVKVGQDDILIGDGITIADANIPQGGKTVVEVQLTSAIMSYDGFQFDVMLPTGISLTKVEKADRLTAIENYTLQQRLTDATNNVYTVSGYNSDRQTIAGTSGAVAYLTLQATANVTVGDMLTAKVQNVVLSTIDEENINAASSTFAITIEEDDGRVTLDKTKLAIEKGQTEVLTATCPSSWTDKRVTWESSDPTVVIVKNGKVKGMKVGTATITCTSVATGLSATCEVTVGYVKLSKYEAVIEKGQTIKLKSAVYPTTLEDQSVTWESSNTKIATVSDNGEVTGVKAGNATITCTSNATGLSATCEVTVGYVKLSKYEVAIEKGQTIKLKSAVYPTTLEDQSVTWKSSNTKVATVSDNGEVTGVKAGTATITCTSNATGLSATCEVTVGYVKLSKYEVVIEKGQTITLKSAVYPTTLEDQSVTWESSDPTVVIVKNGKIKGKKAGTATITCTSNATGLSAACEVTVGYVKLSKNEVTIQKGEIATLKYKVYPTTLDQSVTWESSDRTIVKVTATGKIGGINVGTATITCTSVATGLKATCVVTVTAADAARSLDGNDNNATEIDDMDVDPTAKEPFDVYDLNGRKVLRQATSLDALPRGTYIVNGKKIMK